MSLGILPGPPGTKPFGEKLLKVCDFGQVPVQTAANNQYAAVSAAQPIVEIEGRLGWIILEQKLMADVCINDGTHYAR